MFFALVQNAHASREAGRYAYAHASVNTVSLLKRIRAIIARILSRKPG